MQQTRQLIDALKRCLRARGLAYRDVAEQLQLSEASVKRIFSRGTFSLERLESVCALVELRISDLCRIAEQQEGMTGQLSLEQESALARSPRLLRCFYRLLSGWDLARVARHHDLGRHEATRLAARLDRLGLVDCLPGGRIQVLTGQHIRWRRDGPLWRRYAEAVQKDFMADGFREEGGHLEFESGELSPGSLSLVQRKLGRLALEFRELVELDAGLDPEARRHVALLTGVKPWIYAPLFHGEPSLPDSP